MFRYRAVSWHPTPHAFLRHGKLLQDIVKINFNYIKMLDNLFKVWLLLKASKKSQTRRKTGTENHGSYRDSRVAWKGRPGFFMVIGQSARKA